MRQKIENSLLIECTDVDLTTVSNMEFYIRQSNFFACYTPIVISASEMVVAIPFRDARRLRPGNAELQFAFVDADGVPRASDPVTENVHVLIKEGGYDPGQGKSN